MLHAFSINRIKLVARTPTATDIKGRREYILKHCHCVTIELIVDILFCFAFSAFCLVS
jgi:hypothetical protein